MTDVRLPPHSIEAEQSLLGALLLDPGAMDRVGRIVSGKDFYRETHAVIFEAIAQLGDQADAVTVADWFAQRKQQARVDNGAYLTMLANDTPGAANAIGYARVVRDKADKRRLIQLGTGVADAALNGGEVAEICEQLHSELSGFDVKGTTGPRSLRQIAGSWIEHLDRLAQIDQRIDTGLVDVDRILHNLLPGELMVLAGRPGMGKTTAAMSIVRHVAKAHPVLVFSLEMSAEQLLKKMVAGRGVDGTKFRDPRQLTDGDWSEITRGLAAVKQLRLDIDDTAGISAGQIAARAREAKRHGGLALVVVDYLQLVTAKAENRFQEVSLISREMKKLAKNLDVPVIALSQLSRDVERRMDKRPSMPDLRESGQLEQDADIIVFLYRNGVYDKGDDTGITEWILAKHRDAVPGTAYTKFHGHRGEFVNADQDLVESYLDRLRVDDGAPQHRSKKTAWQRRQAGGDA